MSYIYALYFVEPKAVKVGKANNLINRLSDLVSTWGNIDPYRAKAWEKKPWEIRTGQTI